MTEGCAEKERFLQADIQKTMCLQQMVPSIGWLSKAVTCPLEHMGFILTIEPMVLVMISRQGARHTVHTANSCRSQDSKANKFLSNGDLGLSSSQPGSLETDIVSSGSKLSDDDSI